MSLKLINLVAAFSLRQLPVVMISEVSQNVGSCVSYFLVAVINTMTKAYLLKKKAYFGLLFQRVSLLHGSMQKSREIGLGMA